MVKSHYKGLKLVFPAHYCIIDTSNEAWLGNLFTLHGQTKQGQSEPLAMSKPLAMLVAITINQSGSITPINSISIHKLLTSQYKKGYDMSVRFWFLVSLLFSFLAAFSAPLHAQIADDPFASSSASSFASSEPEFLPVEQAYQLNIDFQAANQLRLNWQIQEGYYLYRHAFKFQLQDASEVYPLEPIISKGLEKTDEYFGDVEVYYRDADIDLKGVPAIDGLQLTIVSQGCADAGLCYPPRKQYFAIDMLEQRISELETPRFQAIIPTPAANPGSAGNNAQVAANTSLWMMLLFAMAGGFILNLMPCVFPVLSLKVLSFTNDTEHNHSLHGWSYTAGVILSFILVAALLLGLRAGGEAIGWGFHLQSPWFVALLAYLFFAMGLSLSGFFEMGSSWMNIGSSLANRSGYSGSFFTGVLATVVASPCTAPFMGTALGFAITQSSGIALAVFAALGFGMALPVLLLSLSPKLLAFMPKPGPWMDSFKQFLAFPLYASAIWLGWVVGNQTGVNGMAIVALGCLLLALACWLWNDKLVNRSISAICAALAVSLLSSTMLKPVAKIQDVSGQNWEPFSSARLQELRSQGQAVFVNATADWCITCLANERVTLSTDTIKRAMTDNNVVYLKADWTNRDPQITALLSEFGRTGVPLYVAYPANPQAQPMLLPQLLTTDIVLEALNQL